MMARLNAAIIAAGFPSMRTFNQAPDDAASTEFIISWHSVSARRAASVSVSR